MPDDQDPSALAAWFTDPATPDDVIRPRLARLSTYQWRAFYPIADSILTDQDRWAMAHAAARRHLLDAERRQRAT